MEEERRIMRWMGEPLVGRENDGEVEKSMRRMDDKLAQAFLMMEESMMERSMRWTDVKSAQ